MMMMLSLRVAVLAAHCVRGSVLVGFLGRSKRASMFLCVLVSEMNDARERKEITLVRGFCGVLLLAEERQVQL